MADRSDEAWTQLGTHIPQSLRRQQDGLLGHRDVRTTMIYTHVLNRGAGAERSPADRLIAVAGTASGGQPASRSWSATRAALAGYHHQRGDDGGREGVESRVLASFESEVESVVT